MEADPDTYAAVRAVIDRGYDAMSAPGRDLETVFGHPSIAVAGSGQGELLYGPEQVIGVAQMIAAHGARWTADEVRVWRDGDIAWAQILGRVGVQEDGGDVDVPYWTTGVFGLGQDGWQWLYWGGAEPQEHPRV